MDSSYEGVRANVNAMALRWDDHEGDTELYEHFSGLDVT